jgi:hypothetical protein
MWYYSLNLLGEPPRLVYSRPFGSVSEEWTPSEAVGTGNNYLLVSEEIANANTYVFVTSEGKSDTYFLSPLRRPPDNTDLILRLGIFTKNSIAVKANLYDGSSLIVSSDPQTSENANTIVSLTIPYATWSGNIMNWTDLRLQITSSSV